jgi:UDP-N-acetylmuramoyl-L-alanyl-D-glutamate--2,6-diaminopimelate ligase
VRLGELLKGIDGLDTGKADLNAHIRSVTNDSRKAGPGSLFVALKGTATDGHLFAPAAVSNGAVCIVHQDPLTTPEGVSRVHAVDTGPLYALLAARIAGEPSRKLRVIGVTGTNGKTSVTIMLDSILRAAGRRCAILGTLGFRPPLAANAPDTLSFVGRGLTTPDAADLQNLLAACVLDEAECVAMEVSSHALVQRRVDHVHYRGRLFTNLTQDHLDYHHTMEKYAEAKLNFFTRPELGRADYAVANWDDALGSRIAAEADCTVLRYGMSGGVELTARIQRQNLEGIQCRLSYNGLKAADAPPSAREPFEVLLESPLIGSYNISNMMAAAGGAVMEGVEPDAIRTGLMRVKRIPGRLERVPNKHGVHVLVDYAHTPDALAKVLATIRQAAGAGTRIICVFGCGGDRDRDKRPKMGLAAAGADILVVTSDNPRSENPLAIITGILGGIPHEAESRCIVEPDRREAIGLARELAHSGDVVLIAGKGHEDYQIFADRTERFSDVEVARELLQ